MEPTTDKVNSIGEALALVTGILPGLAIEKSLGPGVVFSHSTGKYFVMYKREYYKNFKHHFPEVLKSDGKSYGWAQIMTRELLNYSAHDDSGIDWILFVTPDGKAYRAASRLFKRFVDKHNTEVPHLKGEVAMPLDYFNNLEEVMKNGIHGITNTEATGKAEDKVQSSISEINEKRNDSKAAADSQDSLQRFI
jgi:hypothetical protein